MTHPLLEITDMCQLMDIVVMQVKAANPALKIGEKITAFNERVFAGRIVPRELTPDPVVQLDYEVPHVVRPAVTVGRIQTVKLPFNDPSPVLEQFKLMSGYLHPFDVSIPHARWLKHMQPGETVNLHDKNYYTSPHTLTQEDFDKHSYVTFRFALSDQ